MVAISLLNDKVTTIPINFLNSSGGSVSAPAGDSWTVVSSSPSLVASIGGTASAPNLVLTPTVQAGSGYTVTVNDAKGLPALVGSVTIAPDPAVATSMTFPSYVLWSTAPQAIPANPGP